MMIPSLLCLIFTRGNKREVFVFVFDPFIRFFLYKYTLFGREIQYMCTNKI